MLGGKKSDTKEYSMIPCIWSSRTGKTTLMVIEIWTVFASGNLLERRQGNFLGWWRYLYFEWGAVTWVYNFSKLIDVNYTTILQEAYWGKNKYFKASVILHSLDLINQQRNIYRYIRISNSMENTNYKPLLQSHQEERLTNIDLS